MCFLHDDKCEPVCNISTGSNIFLEFLCVRWHHAIGIFVYKLTHFFMSFLLFLFLLFCGVLGDRLIYLMPSVGFFFQKTIWIIVPAKDPVKVIHLLG